MIPYLDALDRITHRVADTHAMVLVRELRTRRDGLFGLHLPARALDIRARDDTVGITAVPWSAVRRHRIAVTDQDTADDVLRRAHELDKHLAQ